MSINDLINRNKRLAETNSQLIQQLSPMETYLGIGITNKRFIPCIYEGANLQSSMSVDIVYVNISSGNLEFFVSIPPTV